MSMERNGFCVTLWQFPRQDAHQQGISFDVRVPVNFSALRNRCSIVTQEWMVLLGKFVNKHYIGSNFGLHKNCCLLGNDIQKLFQLEYRAESNMMWRICLSQEKWPPVQAYFSCTLYRLHCFLLLNKGKGTVKLLRCTINFSNFFAH
jgi:hypothetical protein